ncbi:MAG: hypothetical protein MPJ50_00155 [Pirellulales bacterium]|nr:hypothetical protein [Pirellulales bacterium]
MNSHASPKSNRRLLALPLILVSAFVFIGQTASAQPTDEELTGFASPQGPSVFIRLESGREFTGVADPRSDEHRLWLRFQGRSMKVLRPVDWSRVAEARVDGVSVPVEDFQANISDFAAAEYNIWELSPDHGMAGKPQAANAGPSHAELAEHVLGTAPRVASISTDVSLGRWDADVEPDGLLVTLYPTSEQGWFMPASGTLEVTLYAAQNSKVTSNSTVRQLGRWTVPVHAEEFIGGPPRYKLPFQAIHPEFDLEIAHLGLVNVKFSSPGAGVFEDSAASVRIREHSPIRDFLQRDGRSRFLPGESVSRPGH